MFFPPRALGRGRAGVVQSIAPQPDCIEVGPLDINAGERRWPLPVGSVIPSLGLAGCGRSRYIGGGGMQIAARSKLTCSVKNIASGESLVSITHAASRFAVPPGKVMGSNTQPHP